MASFTRGCHSIVAGYGLPGREAASRVLNAGGTVAVIELNGQTVRRCAADAGASLRFVCGDASDEACLREAGVETAVLLVLSLPDDAATIKAIESARRINPSIRVFARMHYTSTGMQARAHGAEGVVVAEQVVARELAAAVLGATDGSGSSEPDTRR